ncbi:hypothetical protein BJ956_003770 [Arthrobacter psychrochitiniphilus]|nr:hypothetical protein [Arthrobacter psychrochitiniphilus]
MGFTWIYNLGSTTPATNGCAAYAEGMKRLMIGIASISAVQ